VKTILFWIGAVFAVIGMVTVALIIVISVHESSEEIIYDCELIEMLPNVPDDVKIECKKFRPSKFISV